MDSMFSLLWDHWDGRGSPSLSNGYAAYPIGFDMFISPQLPLPIFCDFIITLSKLIAFVQMDLEQQTAPQNGKSVDINPLIWIINYGLRPPLFAMLNAILRCCCSSNGMVKSEIEFDETGYPSYFFMSIGSVDSGLMSIFQGNSSISTESSDIEYRGSI